MRTQLPPFFGPEVCAADRGEEGCFFHTSWFRSSYDPRMADLSDEEREDFARQYGVQVRRARRSPPRLPVGALRLRGEGVDGCIPLATGDVLTERDKGYFKLLHRELMNVIRYGAEDNLLVPTECLEALRATAPAVFGCELSVALWLVPFRVELEASRSKRLALETSEGNPITTDLRPLVEEVMARTRRSVQRLDPSADLPSWLSPSLVELMVRRCSYAGGGGAG